MTTPCHLLAPLGLSPAVVTEAIWWLVTHACARFVAVEVWITTRSDCQDLESRLDTLRGAVGEAALPRDVLIVTPFGQPDNLDDIASSDDAELVLRRLRERVEALTRSLPDDTALVGLLSGGRKTMSASLMTAFCLHGRRIDPLYHVWLEPKFERRLRAANDLETFSFPEDRWRKHLINPDASPIVVHEQPYPLLRNHGHAEVLTRRWPDAVERPTLLFASGHGRSWFALENDPDSTRVFVKPCHIAAWRPLLRGGHHEEADLAEALNIRPPTLLRYLQHVAKVLSPFAPDVAPVQKGSRWQVALQREVVEMTQAPPNGRRDRKTRLKRS